LKERLNPEEERAVKALAKASAEALHATVLKLRERDARRLEAKVAKARSA
jgi:hypothetical protein